MFTLQITGQYNPVVHTLLYAREADAVAALELVQETIAKGKFRNEPDTMRIAHDAGVAVFRGSEVASATMTDIDKWEAMRPAPQPKPSEV